MMHDINVTLANYGKTIIWALSYSVAINDSVCPEKKKNTKQSSINNCDVFNKHIINELWIVEK